MKTNHVISRRDQRDAALSMLAFWQSLAVVASAVQVARQEDERISARVQTGMVQITRGNRAISTWMLPHLAAEILVRPLAVSMLKFASRQVEFDGAELNAFEREGIPSERVS